MAVDPLNTRNIRRFQKTKDPSLRDDLVAAVLREVAVRIRSEARRLQLSTHTGQEAMHKAIEKVNDGAPSVHDRRHFVNVIMLTFRRQLLDFRRSKRRRLAREICMTDIWAHNSHSEYASTSTEPAVSDGYADPAEPIMSAEIRDCLTVAMDRLPEDVFEAVYLRYFESLSLTEIASIQGCALSTVHRRVNRAVDILRSEFSP